MQGDGRCDDGRLEHVDVERRRVGGGGGGELTVAMSDAG